LILRNN